MFLVVDHRHFLPEEIHQCPKQCGRLVNKLLPDFLDIWLWKNVARYHSKTLTVVCMLSYSNVVYNLFHLHFICT